MLPARAAAVSLLVLCACAEEHIDPAPLPAPPPPAPEFCDPLDHEQPTRFVPCTRGSGAFGRWTIDPAGFPAYVYTLDQHADDRALWFNTEGKPWRHHFAAFGNRRVNAMASNDGWIELVTQDRGVEYLNKVDDAQGWFGGGSSYVDDGEATWSTAYRYRPEGAETERVFGMGYARMVTTHRAITVDRVTYAPWGDAPYVVDEVRITNHASAEREIAHYEVFDVARRPIEINWLVSGDPFTSVPDTARRLRDEKNARYDETATYDAASRVLGVRRSHAAGSPPLPPDARSPENHYPPDPFLAALVGDVHDTFTRTSAFIGSGSFAAPDAVALRLPGESAESGDRGEVLNGLGQPRMLGMKTELSIEPGATAILRFAYGYAPMGEAWVVDEALRDPAHDGLADYRGELAKRLVYFVSNDEPALHRELAWHAYQVQASVGRRDYFEGLVVPQGSAYLYLHGADGASRDLGIFAVPLTYVDPELARAELELYMRVQFAGEGRFTYAFQGHGMLDDAMGIHQAPSDLDLFFLWALVEYVGATGDVAFLERAIPFWPKEATPGAIAWDHVVASIRHLFDVVGTGEHGLVRVGTGDWSDGIVVEAPNRELAIAEGESVPNTQMAIAVLPRVADLIEARDPALAAEIRDRVEALRVALPSAWAGSFYGRAYYGDGALLRADRVDLEAQVWALIGDSFASPADRASTIDAIHTELDRPSPGGATLQPGGQVWPAISGLLTEGYARTRPDLAWAHMKRNTMFSHARAYPDVWFGIWSAPDGMNGPGGDRPGGTWFSLVTPMTDFPVQNNNQHLMPLLAALRLAGVQATARGLRIEPKIPRPRFSMATQLVTVDKEPRALEVRYAPTGQALRLVELVAPAGQRVTAATHDGAPIDVPDGATSVVFEVIPRGAEEHVLRIETSP